MGDGETVGTRLRGARRQLRLSQTAVASHLRTTRQVVAAFEQGTRCPDLDQMVGLANLYRLTLDELMTTARSAIRPTPTPAFAPRFNADEELTPLDRAELASFAQYLRQRPPVPGAAIARRPLESIAATVRRWRDANGADRDVPVPVFAMLARRGIEVRFTAFEKLAGALLLLPNCPAGVLINSDQPSDRQRYSAAHELGHLVLGHTPRGDHFVSPLGRRFDPVEVHADQFAAELLVPADLLEEHLTALPGGEPPAHQVFRLAQRFMVSFQAMALRLGKLGVLSPADSAAIEGVKPGDIARTLGMDRPRSGAPFRVAWLPEVATRVLPPDWHHRASADTVRLLQEAAYSAYVARAPESERSGAGAVYEQVALWVARTYPLVSV